MKTTTYHISNLGSMTGHASAFADASGYVEIHDSPKYATMDREDLETFLENHRNRLCRAAAATELANRGISSWQDGNDD